MGPSKRLDVFRHIHPTAEIQIVDIWDSNQKRMMVTKHQVQLATAPSKQLNDGDQTPCSTYHGAVKAGMLQRIQYTAESQLETWGWRRLDVFQHIQPTAEIQIVDIWDSNQKRMMVTKHRVQLATAPSKQMCSSTFNILTRRHLGFKSKLNDGDQTPSSTHPGAVQAGTPRNLGMVRHIQHTAGSQLVEVWYQRQPVISAEDEKKERRRQQRREYYAQNATRIREQSRVKMAEKRRAASAVCCPKNETSQIGHPATSEFVQRGTGCIASAHLHATTQKSELRHNTNASNIAGDIDDEIAVDREIACLVEQAHQETTSSSESESSEDGNDKRRPTATIGSGDASCSKHQDQTSAGVNGSNKWRPSLRLRLPSPAPNSPSPSPKGRMPSLYDSLW
ncbi:hypothetical protein C8R45DRAFT_947751 [Mycena sanguinolenta]|nr:hypothetical protein C8R45DRAFT_947751 [Mycena sanguinolenta]